MIEKVRLDVAMLERGFVDSREKGKALIMAGLVYINGQKETKAGASVKSEDCIELRGEKMPFVSRGGYKLKKAVDEFGLTLDGCVCMDIGASTGGFTDCMLTNGAKKVYSIDVGYGQLAWKLRQDERVVNMERTNIRNVTEEQIGEKLDFASVDVSFISLKHVLPVARKLLKEGGEMVCLIKPQFEAEAVQMNRGVVKNERVRRDIIKKFEDWLKANGFIVIKKRDNDLAGKNGNLERFYYLELAKK